MQIHETHEAAARRFGQEAAELDDALIRERLARIAGELGLDAEALVDYFEAGRGLYSIALDVLGPLRGELVLVDPRPDGEAWNAESTRLFLVALDHHLKAAALDTPSGK